MNGLRVKNAAGAVIFDTNTKTARIKGVVTITTTSGSIPMTLSPGKTPFHYVLAPDQYAPVFTYSGGNWTWTTFSGGTVQFIYGEY